MPAAKAKKPPKETGPDDLVRETAGSYVSGDKRFEVRQSDNNWYVVDREQSNEFGQELIHGPFASMKAAKDQMPGLRDIKPLPRTMPRPKRAAAREAPKPQPTWIDKLSTSEATEVRRQIKALTSAGIADAEQVVRRDRQGLQPAIATALLQARLEELVNGLPESDQRQARMLMDNPDDLLASGNKNAAPLTGWELIELGADRQPTGRKLSLKS